MNARWVFFALSMVFIAVTAWFYGSLAGGLATFTGVFASEYGYHWRAGAGSVSEEGDD